VVCRPWLDDAILLADHRHVDDLRGKTSVLMRHVPGGITPIRLVHPDSAETRARPEVVVSTSSRGCAIRMALPSQIQ
jgi:hypothetical protein